MHSLKLIDFGAAREGLPSDRLGLTQGGFIGTPAYASPEQFLEASHLDARSDLYSLGAVLWFCLTGKPPFNGTQFEVMFHHVNTEPDWKKLPAMPEAALSLLKRLLAKFQNERPDSPAVLVKELQRRTSVAPSPDRCVSAPRKKSKRAISVVTNRLWRRVPMASGGFGGRGTCSPRGSWRCGCCSRSFAPSRHSCSVLNTLPPTCACWSIDAGSKCGISSKAASACRLATEWVEGPTTYGLMKARQCLPLADALPLLAQVAEAMDFAASQGLMVVETAPERLPIQVEGWAGMPENERSMILRHPLSKWPEWGVKVCPLRLSMTARDYMLPTDIEAGQAISRIATDFVALCYQLLTGQDEGTRRLCALARTDAGG